MTHNTPRPDLMHHVAPLCKFCGAVMQRRSRRELCCCSPQYSLYRAGRRADRLGILHAQEAAYREERRLKRVKRPKREPYLARPEAIERWRRVFQVEPMQAMGRLRALAQGTWDRGEAEA